MRSEDFSVAYPLPENRLGSSPVIPMRDPLTSLREPQQEAGQEDAWDALRLIDIDPSIAANSRILGFERRDPASSAFDVVRTKLLQTLRENNWRSVAITSPTAGCGKTVVGLNLAFSLAHQKDCRTVLADFDLRRPQVANALGLREAPSMRAFLEGRAGIERTFLRFGANLAFAPNDAPVPMPAELLQSAETARAIDAVRQGLAPDVMIFDLPPMLASDDVMAFLPHVDCVMLVAAAGQTTIAEIELCEREFEGRANFFGVVLNRCHTTMQKYGY